MHHLYNIHTNHFYNSKFPGVIKRGNKYQSRIGINNKRISLGYFNTPEEADKDGKFFYPDIPFKIIPISDEDAQRRIDKRNKLIGGMAR